MATLTEVMAKKTKFYYNEQGHRWCCKFRGCITGGTYSSRDSSMKAAKAHLLSTHVKKKVKS